MDEDHDTVNGGIKKSKNHEILIFAFPKHGHISPLLQFSKRLSSNGLSVTFLTTSSASQSIQFDLHSPNLILHFISDSPPSGAAAAAATSLDEYFHFFKASVSKSFSEFISEIRSGSGKDNYPKFLVYDSVMPWMFDLARELRLEAAPFFTQSSAVNRILYHVYEGSLKIPPENLAISLPSMPILQAEDLPSFPGEMVAAIGFMISQFSNFQKAKWIFLNTFDQLEGEVINWMADRWPIKTVGPTIPSAYLDGRLEDDKLTV